MRNLKRALSLTLASVMLLGMMVIGSSAVAGYSDVDADDNVEAIEVLQAIEVMVGDDRGFGPDRPVNRAEMAVVMGLLLNLDYNYYVSTCPFADVSGNYEWARGWVGACAANGIVSGRGEGIYDPGATVTAIEAASMMMRALGYFQNAEDYSDGFVLVTVRQGNQIGLFNGVGSDGSTPMTRNQVAQMALNALRSEMVDFTGTPGIEVNGVKVGYRAEYTSRTSTEAKYNAIEGRTSDVASDANHKGQYYVQLGEELYNGDLRLNNNALDDFGRPSRHWEYDGKSIGTYIKKELIREEYTEKVTGKMLYDLLTKETIDRYDFVITVDGETEKEVLNPKEDVNYGYFTKNNLIRTNTEAVGATGKGVLTQVFVDNSKDLVYISVINTYLAQASDDYNEKKDEASFDIYGIEEVTKAKALVKNTGDKDAKAGKQAYIENRSVDGDMFDVKDVKDGDIVLVHVAEGEIKEIIDPEVIDSTSISSFKKGSWVNADGTKYDYANTALYDTEVLDEYDETNMKNTNYRVFLDMYGYAIGLEILEEPDQFLFLAGIDQRTSNLTNKTAEGNVIFLDGTSDTVKIKMDKSETAQGNRFTGQDDTKSGLTHADVHSNGTAAESDLQDTYISALMNTWCKYTVDKNGNYILTEIANTKTTFEANGNKFGQSHTMDKGAASNTYNAADVDDDMVVIDKKHVTLYGIVGSDFKRVYGNENTVYLSAETDLISKADQAVTGTDVPAVVISGVGGVTTGVKNASLQAWNADQVVFDDGVSGKYQKMTAMEMRDVSQGVYTLFKDNGYVVAAVVVGEDQGSNSDFVFVTSADGKPGLSQEGYDKEKDEWTWHRDVIINGKTATLTEKGSGSPAIKDMDRDGWYEVRYDADGNVRKVIDINGQFDDDVGKYINNMEHVEDSVEDNDTVILHHDLGDRVYDVSVVGNTLQIETKQLSKKMGFAVADDANIVLIQDKSIDGKHSTDMDDIFEYSNGEKGLQKAVNRLNGNIKGHVSAILEGGVATSVIIWDLIENDVITGSGEYEDSESPAKAVADLDKLEITELVTVDGDVKTPISEALKAAGFKRVSKWDLANDKVTAIDEDGNEVEFEITATEVEYFSVTVDDKVVEHVKSGDDAKLVVKDIKGKGTGYETNAGATAAYAAYSTTSTTSVAASVSKAIVIKTGYVAVSGFVAGATGTAGTGASAANAAITGGTPTYAEVGDKLEIKVTTTATADATTGTTVTITATGATPPAAQDITKSEAVTGKVLTFELTVGETDITAIGCTIAANTDVT